MPVSKPTVLPRRRGEADAQHHKQRVRRQITDHLRKKIGEEDIITQEGKIKVPVKGNKRYRFILDRGPKEEAKGTKGPQPGTDPGEEMYEVWLDMEEVEEMLFAELDLPRLKPKKEEVEVTDYKFDTYAVKGPQVDKKATLRKNLLRNAAQGKPGVGDFKKGDMRYISWHDKPTPKSKAVVFLMMDQSGSMGDFHKRVARLFFYWTVRFLRYRYDNVDVRFIGHTTEATEMQEHEFFNRVESGGTMVSSAYRLAEQIQRLNYPQQDWNIYVLHASDGDNWQLDNEDTFAAIKRLCKVSSMVGYLEMKAPSYAMWGPREPTWSTLINDLGAKKDELGEEFLLLRISQDKDIWTALKYFFKKENVEESVR
jgi:uncharacterized protein